MGESGCVRGAGPLRRACNALGCVCMPGAHRPPSLIRVHRRPQRRKVGSLGGFPCFLTPYPRRGFERAPGPPRGAFRPPSCLAPLAPRGQPGLIRTARGSFIGLPVGRKARGLVFDDFGPATCRPSKSSKKHSQTLNLDLSFSDRARSLHAVSIPWAAGTVQARASIDDVLPSSLKAAASATRKHRPPNW